MIRLPTVRNVLPLTAAVLMLAFVASPGASAERAPVRDLGNSDGSTSFSVLQKRGFICEKSDDVGRHGALGCFKDKGDEWYACDVHRGGSGTAYIRAGEYRSKLASIGEVIGVEEDNATDGTSVLGDCDEGPEVNIDNGNWIRLVVCIEIDDDWKENSCDQWTVQE